MTLQTIWFILWGLLWAIYFILDGFDLGMGAMLTCLGKDETQRRTILNAMGPFWDGNEVWLITAGGVTFAAFPKTYAVMFSTLYSPLMLLLFALILRGITFEFRSKVASPTWRSLWGNVMVYSSLAAALLLGVAFANIFKGVPFDTEGVFHGTILTLLNPYGLLGGALFILLFLVHGMITLVMKSDGELAERTAKRARALWIPLLIIAALFLLASAWATPLWNNFKAHPAWLIVPLLAVVGLILQRLFMAKESWGKAWFFSALTIASATFFGIIGLYPNLYPSSLDPAASLTLTNSSSSPLTLKIMFVVALIFVPLVIIYQALVYRLFRGKVTNEDMHY